MIENTLFFIHYALTLLFGIVLSFAFCGLRLNKKNIFYISLFFAISGILQLVILNFFGEVATWKLYPLIVHLPLGIVLCAVFRKKPVTVLSSIAVAYLCCQPSKWIGLLTEAITQNRSVVLSVRIITVLIVSFVAIKFLASYMSEIFGKDNLSVLIFGSIPLVYYLFDYIVEIYTDLWNSHNQVTSEFLSFFLCIVFVAFCVIYYKEYEKKADAERKEQLIKITVQQQAKELDAIKKSNLETQLLRHDMRLLLSNLALSIEQNDKENSLKMISGFVAQIESTSLHRYCKNDTVNYILTNFETKCRDSAISFSATVEIEEITVDEILFSSIISNALDNAFNAQVGIPEEKRQIKIMLKDSDGKLLLSVKNPFLEKPVFIDNLPISNKKGHGYGTQSIRYLTERLGGKCQFLTQDDFFILRVVL